MRITALITALVFLVAAPASAAFTGLLGAGNDIPSAVSLDGPTNDPTWNPASCSLSAEVGFASLAAPAPGGVGDVDVFGITLPADCILTAITTPIAGLPGFSVPDTMMQLTDSSGAQLAFNDDAGGLGSAIRYLTTFADTYYLWVTAWSDFGFTGAHSDAGDYILTVSVAPEPGTLALLAGGALFLLRRRR